MGNENRLIFHIKLPGGVGGSYTKFILVSVVSLFFVSFLRESIKHIYGRINVVISGLIDTNERAENLGIFKWCDMNLLAMIDNLVACLVSYFVFPSAAFRKIPPMKLISFSLWIVAFAMLITGGYIYIFYDCTKNFSTVSSANSSTLALYVFFFLFSQACVSFGEVSLCMTLFNGVFTYTPKQLIATTWAVVLLSDLVSSFVFDISLDRGLTTNSLPCVDSPTIVCRGTLSDQSVVTLPWSEHPEIAKYLLLCWILSAVMVVIGIIMFIVKEPKKIGIMKTTMIQAKKATSKEKECCKCLETSKLKRDFIIQSKSGMPFGHKQIPDVTDSKFIGYGSFSIQQKPIIRNSVGNQRGQQQKVSCSSTDHIDDYFVDKEVIHRDNHAILENDMEQMYEVGRNENEAFLREMNENSSEEETEIKKFYLENDAATENEISNTNRNETTAKDAVNKIKTIAEIQKEKDSNIKSENRISSFPNYDNLSTPVTSTYTFTKAGIAITGAQTSDIITTSKKIKEQLLNGVNDQLCGDYDDFDDVELDNEEAVRAAKRREQASYGVSLNDIKLCCGCYAPKRENCCCQCCMKSPNIINRSLILVIFTSPKGIFLLFACLASTFIYVYNLAGLHVFEQTAFISSSITNTGLVGYQNKVMAYFPDSTCSTVSFLNDKKDEIGKQSFPPFDYNLMKFGPKNLHWQESHTYPIIPRCDDNIVAPLNTINVWVTFILMIITILATSFMFDFCIERGRQIRKERKKLLIQNRLREYKKLQTKRIHSPLHLVKFYVLISFLFVIASSMIILAIPYNFQKVFLVGVVFSSISENIFHYITYLLIPVFFSAEFLYLFCFVYGTLRLMRIIINIPTLLGDNYFPLTPLYIFIMLVVMIVLVILLMMPPVKNKMIKQRIHLA